MRPRLRDERGGVLVLAAAIIPVILLFIGFTYDVGTWYTHKRQLQTRADAAALAAGVEYGARWQACGSSATKAAAEGFIASAARRFGGDPEEAGVLRNTEVTEQARVNVEVNAPPSLASDVNDDTSWNDAGVTGGIGPCDPHPADNISPNPNSIWTQVGVRERNQRTLFGMFGVDLLRNRAHARVELQPALAGKGFIPIAVPEQDIVQAELRYYRMCNEANPLGGAGNPRLLTVPLRRLGTGYQTTPGTTFWGPTVGNVVGGTPAGVTLNMPASTDCPVANEYNPVAAEVAVAGVGTNIIDISTQSCATLATSRYADCWSRVSNIRVFKDNPTTQPWFQELEINGSGNPACTPDGYFQVLVDPATNCRYTGSVSVNWNGFATGAPASRFDLSIDGVALDPPNGPGGSPNGVWTIPGTILNSTIGADSVRLDWFAHPTTPNCRNNSPRASNVSVHSIYLNNDANGGILDLVRTSGTAQVSGGAPGPPMHWFRANPSVTPVTVYPTVGLESSLYVGQRRILRASGPQSNQSLDCEPNTGGQGHDFQMFYTGCDPWYTDNKYAGPPWWFSTPAPGACPDIQGIRVQPNSPDDAWECVAKAPGFSPPVIGDGIAAAIGNCANINNNACQQTACTNYNYYDPANPNQWALQGGEPSPRVVFLFIVPYNAFRNTGPQDGLPILNFAAFYITGWRGTNGQSGANPCAGSDPDGAGPAVPDETLQPGEIAGYFVGWTMPSAPGNPNAVCVQGQIRPCVPVLVR